MNSNAALRMRMRWPAVLAVLSALTACSILDGPTVAPASARVTIGGPGPGPLMLVTSNQFVEIFDNFGNRRQELILADTSFIDPGYDADLALGNGGRIYVSLARPLETEATPVVSLRLQVRDEEICNLDSITLVDDNPLVCSYTFNG